MKVKLRPKAPALILRLIRPVDDQLKDLVSALAFKWGCAQTCHFNRLNDMVNLVYIGADSAQALNQTVGYCETLFLNVLSKIQQRYTETQTLCANEDETNAISHFYHMQDAFWAQQPGDRWDAAAKELVAFKQDKYDERR